MFFGLVTIVFLFIGLIAFTGDYEQKEIKKDYEYFRRLTNEFNKKDKNNKDVE